MTNDESDENYENEISWKMAMTNEEIMTKKKMVTAKCNEMMAKLWNDDGRNMGWKWNIWRNDLWQNMKIKAKRNNNKQ